MMTETRRVFAVHVATGAIYEEGLQPDQLMQAGPILKFTIEYPLTNPKTVELTHEDGSGWTEQQFVNAVREAYVAVYEEEGENPGLIPGTLNRDRSHGPYGIWGHEIGDLMLEGAKRNNDGSWELFVGS